MKFITFGEIMMRLSTTPSQTFDSNQTFDINIGGSEMNVALSLAASGVDTSIITALPDNNFGRRVLRLLKSFDIETKGIKLQGERIGINFVEQGYNVRPSNLIYDRKHSSFSESTPSDYNFDELLSGYDWFHFSGITPALNENSRDVLTYALKAAKKHGLKISLDLNYRSSLWSFEEARKVMSTYASYCDLLIGYEPLNLLQDGKDIKDDLKRNPNHDTLKPILDKIHDDYDIENIAFTQREIVDGNRHSLKAFISNNKNLFKTETYEVEILDRIGSGDAFTSGLIYSLMNNKNYDDALNKALGNMLYKHTVTGDFITEDIEKMHEVLSKSKELNR